MAGDQQDILEKGFQLAYFIVPDREAALEALKGALNRLKVQCSSEQKRSYWRDKHLKRRITKISRDDRDALQWLIFYESEKHEKRLEQAGASSEQELVVRYVKSLVRMTTAMSSFYVNVGMRRLLQNYSTSEAQKIYELITEHYLGSDEYRRAKSVLMSKLQARFGEGLRAVRNQHGELRFEEYRDQGVWQEMVDECLKVFTPWSTAECPVPPNFQPGQLNCPRLLRVAGPDAIDENQLEMNRCHAFLEPACHRRLLLGLGFSPPEQKLSVPRFIMKDQSKNGGPGPGWSQAAPLSPKEREFLKESLVAEAARRRVSEGRFLRIKVDGAECALLDTERPEECRFEIQEGAELFEVWTRDRREGDLLLAAHRVSYQKIHGLRAASLILKLPGSRKLVLRVTPAADQSAAVSLEFHETPGWFSRARQRGFAGPLIRGLVYGIAAIALVALGWQWGARSARQHALTRVSAPPINAVPDQPKEVPGQSSRHPLVADAGHPVATFRLVSDDLRVRGDGSPDISLVVIKPETLLVNLEMPVDSDGNGMYRGSLRLFMGKRNLVVHDMLKARPVAGGSVVVMVVPASILREGADYLVDLKYAAPGHGMEDLSTYTFHVSAKPR